MYDSLDFLVRLNKRKSKRECPFTKNKEDLYIFYNSLEKMIDNNEIEKFKLEIKKCTEDLDHEVILYSIRYKLGLIRAFLEIYPKTQALSKMTKHFSENVNLYLLENKYISGISPRYLCEKGKKYIYENIMDKKTLRPELYSFALKFNDSKMIFELIKNNIIIPPKDMDTLITNTDYCLELIKMNFKFTDTQIDKLKENKSVLPYLYKITGDEKIKEKYIILCIQENKLEELKLIGEFEVTDKISEAAINTKNIKIIEHVYQFVLTISIREIDTISVNLEIFKFLVKRYELKEKKIDIYNIGEFIFKNKYDIVSYIYDNDLFRPKEELQDYHAIAAIKNDNANMFELILKKGYKVSQYVKDYIKQCNDTFSHKKPNITTMLIDKGIM